MKAVKAGLAVGALIIIYLLAAVIFGVLQSFILSQILAGDESWWTLNVVPFVVMLAAGALGAFVAVWAVGRMFSPLRMLPLAWAFVGFLALYWTFALGWSLAKTGGELIDVKGVLMAVVASVCAVGAATDRDKEARARGASIADGKASS